MHLLVELQKKKKSSVDIVFVVFPGLRRVSAIYCFAGSYVLLFDFFFVLYEDRTESHEQLFFVCELGTADEGECGGRWNQLFSYP